MAKNVNFNAAPLTPGVYFFKNAAHELLYIGKAAHLRSRIRSHFRSGHKDPAFYRQVAHIEWQETNSEIEALILEALLIKKHQPPHNVVLRDDKSYFFVGFTKEKYPKVLITHQPIEIKNAKFKVQNDNEKFKITYIGPFTSGRALRETLRLLQRVFPYCTCSEKHKRPCMRFQLGRCLGICCIRPDRLAPYEALILGEGGTIERVRREYRRNIKNLKAILEGRTPRLLASLNREMAEASRRQDFEHAAIIRDQISSFEWVLAHAHVLTRAGLGSEESGSDEGTTALKELLAMNEAPRRIESYDISNIQGNFAVGSMVVFENGAPKKSDYRKFRIRTVQGANDVAMLKEVFSRRLKHPEWPLPNVVIVDGGIAQVNALASLAPAALTIIGFTKGPQHKGTRLTLSDKRTIPFERLPEPLKNLLTHVDNEAHRFAISYYRKLHRRRIKERN